MQKDKEKSRSNKAIDNDLVESIISSINDVEITGYEIREANIHDKILAWISVFLIPFFVMGHIRLGIPWLPYYILYAFYFAVPIMWAYTGYSVLKNREGLERGFIGLWYVTTPSVLFIMWLMVVL